MKGPERTPGRCEMMPEVAKDLPVTTQKVNAETWPEPVLAISGPFPSPLTPIAQKMVLQFPQVVFNLD